MLSYELTQKILKLAPRHTASAIAPSTFQELRTNTISGLVVWSGASDKTIYGSEAANHAARAWHDSLHLKLNAPFTKEGEILVGLEQARLVKSDRLGDIIVADVIGQVEYLERYGEFPLDQVEFVLKYIKERN